MHPLLERLLDAPCAPRAAQQIAAKPGVYLFSDGERFQYVGQTRNLRARLGQHTRPSGTHYGATLAFLMATKDAASRGFDVKQQRAVLQKDVAFAECFAQAKRTVARWDVQVAEEDDPDVRTVFEVYAHLVLGTDLNTFETH
jgi:predicted GIY-YIG superfamily endonuclease